LSITHYSGITLQNLADQLVQQGTQDVFLWANGKDTFMEVTGEEPIESEGCRRAGLEALLVVRSKTPALQLEDKINSDSSAFRRTSP